MAWSSIEEDEPEKLKDKVQASFDSASHPMLTWPFQLTSLEAHLQIKTTLVVRNSTYKF